VKVIVESKSPGVDVQASYKSRVIFPTSRIVGYESLDGLEFKDGRHDLSQ
jgi:hypothetical protein